MNFPELRDRFNITPEDTIPKNSLLSLLYHVAKIEKESEILESHCKTLEKKHEEAYKSEEKWKLWAKKFGLMYNHDLKKLKKAEAENRQLRRQRENT
jgi:hypothetical protein